MVSGFPFSRTLALNRKLDSASKEVKFTHVLRAMIST